MLTKGWSATIAVAALSVLALSGGCGNPQPFNNGNLQSISFLTQTVPPADAGRLYNVVIQFGSAGDASLPDRFELTVGVLPTGVTLERDRADADLDGLPDEDGAFTGNARLLGVPRQSGSYSFTIKAISTGELPPPSGGAPNPGQPDLAATQPYSVNVGAGSIAILTPTAAEGTSDPAVPAFPVVVSFVNPANPSAFFSWAFLLAGGSNNNAATVYIPREFGLSAFDKSVNPADVATLHADVDETAVPGAPANLSKFEQNFADGGIFVLQAGQQKVQIGGFQSPRGPVREDGPDGGDDISSADPAFMTGLLPDWFQDAGVPKNSRRDLADTLNLSGGDNTLGTEQPVQFSDYFDAGYKSTTPPYAAKYPFTADQYLNAFFVPYTVGVDVTPLAYRMIVEAIDTRGTPLNKADDVIARKAFIVQVQIPDISIDTVLLPAGQAGVLYAAQISLTGGVPPLSADLEFVDGVNDLKATVGDALTKDLFGIELDPRTWQFIGAPRAAAPVGAGPSVELTVRAYAQVMNPTQSGGAQVPTGNPGEFDGTSTATGKTGRHHTFQVNFALPTTPSIANGSLKAGIDGSAYPGDRIVGAGGVPLLAPYPPGFFDLAPGATYPSASAQRAYRWSSTYKQDSSYAVPDPAAPGVPAQLVFETSELLATSGNLTGTTTDRGFLDITFSGLDFYAGLSTAPSPTTFQRTFSKKLTLSVSPDKAIYMRGVQSGELAGQAPTGLLDSSAQMNEPLMTPILLSAGLFTVETGKTAVFQSVLPGQMDILPVLLANGGSGAHTRKSIPSISGYWPAESNKEPYWNYQFGNEAWKHCQQELTWVQAPNASHARVFMWADATKINTFTSASGLWSQKYQSLDVSSGKKRGVLIVYPGGDFFVPAILDAGTSDHGVLFGAEAVVPAPGTFQYDGYGGAGMHPFYTRYYYYPVMDSVPERLVHMHGASSYLQTYSSSLDTSGGWYMGSLGRSATSVAMSADGIWCATALAGGSNVQKFLLWKTDKTPITFTGGTPANVTMLTGKQVGASGTLVDFANSACIVKLGGVAGGPTAANQHQLLPDSLMFVTGGLLYLNENQLDRVFGFSLVNGSLSNISLNTAVAASVAAGTAPFSVSATTGQFIPDTDYLRGAVGPSSVGTQFAFAGNKPAAGTTGPASVALVAGTNSFIGALPTSAFSSDLPTASYPRAGYASMASQNKRLFFLTNLGGVNGVALGSATLRDLTGSDANIYGDLLSPGRLGEGLDFLALSDDGRFAAVVRDRRIGDEDSAYGFGYRPTFHAGNYYMPYSTSWGTASHDIMLLSTDGSDMSSTAGAQHVLFLGTQNPTASTYTYTGDPTVPGYAVGKNHINGYSRRESGLVFAPGNKDLIFDYVGANNTYIPATYGNTGSSSPGWGAFNPGQTSTFSAGVQISVRLNFRNSSDQTLDFAATSNLSNNLGGLSVGSSVGGTTAPFGAVSSGQDFWVTFKSENGNFLYYISDQIDPNTGFTAANRNFMVGFNMTSATINGRASFTPFTTHAATIGFEQFDCNAWNYENRFKSVPGGVTFNTRDAAGILCVIASDASAGAGSATDLEVYVMDTNLGTNLAVLTSAATTGTANAINHLSMSADGNTIAGQIARTTANSNGSRAVLNSNTDLFVVTNVHAVLAGSAPVSFILSAAASHGASVAFAGDGTAAGAQALLYSSGASGATNSTWSTRTLKSIPLASGAVATVLDSTQSHYIVLAGGRTLNDDPATAQ